MKRKAILSVFCLSILTGLFLVNCISTGDNQNFSITPPIPSQTIIPTLTIELQPETPIPQETAAMPLPVPTLLSSPTFTPAIDRIARSRKVQPYLATNGGCRLPCFWGISPGKTTWKEAKTILDRLSLTTDEFKYMDGILHDGSFDYIHNDQRISIGLGLFEEQGVVTIILFGVGNTEIAPYYSLSEILKNYGEPDDVGIYLEILGLRIGPQLPDTTYMNVHLGYGLTWLHMYYSQYATKNKTSDKYLYCPFDPIQNISKNDMALIIQSQDEPLDNKALRKKLGGREISVPPHISDATNMSFSEFYKNMISSKQDFCLEMPIKFWEQFGPKQ